MKIFVNLITTFRFGFTLILSIVLLCEILIAIINIVGMAIGKKTQSSLLGKAKMWVLSITIVLSYMNLFNIIDYNIVIFSSVITIIMQIFVTMDYIKSLIKQKEVVNKKQPIKNIQELMYILFDTKYYMSTI